MRARSWAHLESAAAAEPGPLLRDHGSFPRAKVRSVHRMILSKASHSPLAPRYQRQRVAPLQRKEGKSTGSHNDETVMFANNCRTFLLFNLIRSFGVTTVETRHFQRLILLVCPRVLSTAHRFRSLLDCFNY
jgi:hypothetical protein